MKSYYLTIFLVLISGCQSDKNFKNTDKSITEPRVKTNYSYFEIKTSQSKEYCMYVDSVLNKKVPYKKGFKTLLLVIEENSFSPNIALRFASNNKEVIFSQISYNIRSLKTGQGTDTVLQFLHNTIKASVVDSILHSKVFTGLTKSASVLNYNYTRFDGTTNYIFFNGKVIKRNFENPTDSIEVLKSRINQLITNSKYTQ